MIDSIGATRAVAAGSTPAASNATTSDYASGWAAPSGSATPTILAAAPTQRGEGSSIPASTARAQESALLAADVYNDVAAPPPGFRVADAGDLSRLNLTASQLEAPGSSFRARVYVTGEGASERFVVAFRGSSTGEDWKNNFQQAAGGNSESYAKALLIGERLARSDASVTLAGHSLGGGLASAAAIASGREADTFNASGLSDKTIDQANAINGANANRCSSVQAYQVPGEILSHLQDGGDRLLGGVLFGIPGALLLDAPSAYGQRHVLPDVAPEDKNFFERHSRIDRHSIDWVLAGAGALR